MSSCSKAHTSPNRLMVGLACHVLICGGRSKVLAGQVYFVLKAPDQNARCSVWSAHGLPSPSFCKCYGRSSPVTCQALVCAEDSNLTC